ncbi:MAG: oligosaccharide flippase family protein, partial [Clostridia bacterium]|nr:oligosaccharide flippase family protein [Clostridia bacterium]
MTKGRDGSPRRAAGALPAARQLLGGSALTFAGRVASAGLALLAMALAARILGSEAFGLFGLAQSFTSILWVAVSLGAGTSLLQLVPAWRARAGPSAGRRTALATALFVLALGAAATLAVLAAAEPIAAALGKPEAGPYVRVWALTLVPAATLRVANAANQAEYRFTGAVLPDTIVRWGVTAVALAAIYAGVPDRTAGRPPLWALVTGAFLLGHAAAALVGWAFWASGARGAGLTPRPPRGAGPAWQEERRALAEFLRVAPAFVGSGLVATAQAAAGQLVLARFQPAAEIGYLAAAQRAAQLLALVLTAANMAFAPAAAQLWAEGQRERLARLYRQASRWILAATAPLGVLCLADGRDVAAAFGAGFAPTAAPLFALALGQIVNAATGSVGYVQTMTGHQRHQLANQTAGLATVVGLALVLAPRWGALGAGIASACGLAVANLLGVRQVRRLLAATPFDA